MRKLLFFIASILSFLLQINAQERVYMPFFEVMNMHPDYQYSTSKLFKTYVDNHNAYLLILPAKFDTSSSDNSFEQVKQSAKDLSCPYFIQGEFNRLGDVVIISIAMYSTSDGKKIWHNISKALTPDDIDPIMGKIAQNLGVAQLNDNGDIYDVTSYDSRELNKIGGNRFFGISIGGGTTFITGVDHNFPAGFGIVGSYDMRDWIFNLKGETYFSDVNIYYLNIDAVYPLSSGKNSAFVSGSMGYGGVTLKKNTGIYDFSREYGSGLILFAGGGYLMNRNSNVSLRFSGNLYAPFFKTGGSVPAGFLFSTTLLFGN